jgi:para-nitrobenzyl esterase
MIVDAPCGKLCGLEHDGVLRFRGIPYAKPPVGPLRWRMPEPLPPWSGTRDATRFGAASPQSTSRFDRLTGSSIGALSEDCLYLNVWTTARDGKRPVMLWLHGGAFTHGAGHQGIYDGMRLARRDCVVVTINYRLGALGFLALDGIATGAEGLADQIAALQWVQANIASFGGDPGNVTIFGESAGGMSVGMLMTTPLSQGLFHKAIMQSGPPRLVMPVDLASAERTGLAWAESAGVAGGNLQALRKMSWQDVIAHYDLTKERVGIVIDGKTLPVTPHDAFAQGKQRAVPFIGGANSYEGDLLRHQPSGSVPAEAILSQLGPGRDAALRLYNPDKTLSDDTVASLIIGDRIMVAPTRAAVRDMQKVATHGYFYVFDYVPPTMRAASHGAWHSAEYPYLFGTLDTRHPDHGPATKADEAIGRTMRQFWVNFAKSGNPGTVDGVTWPVDSPGDDRTLVFGNDGPRIERDYLKARLDFVSAADSGH